MKNNIINPNEYGSLFYDNKEKEYLNNVINQKRIFRYSKCDYPYTSMCEDKIRNLVNVKYCLMTTNGTSGLKAALVAANVKNNDRVLISSYTFLATALAVISLGAIPIPIDLDLKNGLNIEEIKKEIKIGCQAIIVVHFQGRAFNLSKIHDLTKKENIVLIEDACQAFGAKFNKSFTGTMGDIGVYSFQQFKQLSCGEGGCVVTNNEKYYNIMRNYTDMGSIRNKFPSWNSPNALFGENYRMNNLNAAVLYAQLEKFDFIINKQKESRARIIKAIKKESIRCILDSIDSSGDTSMNILILLKSEKFKEQAISLAKESNIELRNMWTSLYYDNDLFINNNLDSLFLKGEECSYTKKVINKMLVISVPPSLTKYEEDLIVLLLIKLRKEEMVA